MVPTFAVGRGSCIRSMVPGIALGSSLGRTFSGGRFEVIALKRLLRGAKVTFFRTYVVCCMASLVNLTRACSILVLTVSVTNSLTLCPLMGGFTGEGKGGVPIVLNYVIFSVTRVIVYFDSGVPNGGLILTYMFTLFMSFPFTILGILPNTVVTSVVRCSAMIANVGRRKVFNTTGDFVIGVNGSLTVVVIPSLIMANTTTNRGINILKLGLATITNDLFYVVTVFILLHCERGRILTAVRGTDSGGRGGYS